MPLSIRRAEQTWYPRQDSNLHTVSGSAFVAQCLIQFRPRGHWWGYSDSNGGFRGKGPVVFHLAYSPKLWWAVEESNLHSRSKSPVAFHLTERPPVVPDLRFERSVSR